MKILEERKSQVHILGKETGDIACSRPSTSGSVSQRACVFCGSRVVLYPITDALHVVHGPIGCAAYTWDIRGALSSGEVQNRRSLSTDIREKEVIHGGEKKLRACLLKWIGQFKPRAVFVYSTCITGLIGDDVGAVCRGVSQSEGIPVIPVESEGFKGTKKDGYHAACEALLQLVGTGDIRGIPKVSINILGEYNLAGETWIIRNYYERMGIHVVATITGDGRVDDLRKAHGASLNLVQCSGSMITLAKRMEELYGIPYKRVSYFGMEDTSGALYETADFFRDQRIKESAEKIILEEFGKVLPILKEYRKALSGRRAAIYVGGSFKAFSLVRALRHLGMETAVVGSQTGNAEDYKMLQTICGEGTVIVDDTNPLELAHYLQEKKVDLLIGGVKERPIAYKLGIGFCDHNHERKKPLAGFEGMLQFAKEVHLSVLSPVWGIAKGIEGKRAGESFLTIEKQLSVQSDEEGTCNTCRLCAPLGASLVFKGIEGTIPLLHGSQGCATYIRRYLISHFREPVDIASSSFTETTAVFGGEENLKRGIENLIQQYHPQLIGVATTCLAETMGEDVPALLSRIEKNRKKDSCDEAPVLVSVSTPSYKGTHMDGYEAALHAVVEKCARGGLKGSHWGILLGMMSPADIRHLKEMTESFGTEAIFFPDYSDTLDGGLWEHYENLPQGGTKPEDLARLGTSEAVFELGLSLSKKETAGQSLKKRFGMDYHSLSVPLGIRATDDFLTLLSLKSGKPISEKWSQQKRRLLDLIADGHKYVYGKKTAVYGDEAWVAGIVQFLGEIGIFPVLCMTSGNGETIESALKAISWSEPFSVKILSEGNYSAFEKILSENPVDLLIGSSKGLGTSRKLNIPLVRTGFPIHDRLGAQRLLHAGYEGAAEFFTRIVNTLLEHSQKQCKIGYSYL